MAVIWATQVPEQLAKEGRPSRAEITDTMSARAECVMLNKGARIVEAVAALDDILRAHGGAPDQEALDASLRSRRSVRGEPPAPYVKTHDVSEPKWEAAK